MLRWTCTLLCILAGVLFSARANADERDGEHYRGGGPNLDLGAGVEAATAVVAPHTVAGNSLGGGTGFNIRVGAQYRAPFIRFVPELGYGYDHFFAANSIGAADDWDTHRLLAGLRIGLGEIIVPTVYAHTGYGWRRTGDPTVPDAGGVAFDAGLALDLHLLPILGFGAHAEYAMIDARPYVPQWLAFGLHADLAL